MEYFTMVSLFITRLFHSDNYINIFIKFGSIASTVVATLSLKDGWFDDGDYGNWSACNSG